MNYGSAKPYLSDPTPRYPVARAGLRTRSVTPALVCVVITLGCAYMVGLACAYMGRCAYRVRRCRVYTSRGACECDDHVED